MASAMRPREELLTSLDEQETVRLAQDLVRIDSVNGREAALAEFLSNRCRSEGLEVRLQPVVDGRPNVLAVLPGEKEGIGLLFHGHTDTVPFLGMPDPTAATIREGRLWGRGSVDQKGGLAAATMALMVLARSGIRPRKGVALAAVIDEESEHRGSMGLVDDGLRADAAIVTEPSDLRLLVACKGTAPIRIRFTGVLAHGSKPWLGANAIEMAAQVVLALKQRQMRAVEIPGVGVMRATYNVGLIEGGTAYNNVPDSCTLWLDRRTIPGETQSTALAEIEGLLEDLARDDPKFKATAEIARPDWKWDRIRARGLNPALVPPDSPIARAVAAAHRAETGKVIEIGYTHGYNDGDFLVNDLSIPTVNYGPGETNLSHSQEEALRLDQLITAARVYLRVVLDLVG